MQRITVTLDDDLMADLSRGQLEATRQDRDRWAEAATAALRTLPAPAKSPIWGTSE